VEIEVVTRAVFFERDAIQLRAHVETKGVVSAALFAINNDYLTYIDPQTGLPFRSQETIRDAIKSTDSTQDFSQPGGNEAIPAKQRAFPGTYDILSALYRARSLPLSPGANYSFSIRGETTTYTAELKVTGVEVVRTNVGSFTTLVTEVKISDSILKDIKVYFSDDERHVPVLLTGKVKGAKLTAELAGSEFVKPVETPTPTPMPAPSIAPTPKPTPPPIVVVPEEWPFKIGEQLNYQVFLGPSSTAVGTASFQVRGRSRYHNRDGVLFGVQAQTTGAAARLFQANDQINSYVDPKSLLPYRSEFRLIEGNRRLNQTLTFDQDRGNATNDAGGNIAIPVGTYDYVSFFYAMRLFNLTPGRRNAISILVENKPKTLFVSSIKKEAIQLSDQKIPSIALTLTTDDPQSDKYQLRVWISDDKRRLPLRITAATELGALRADLVIISATVQ
jgi:hypothetical protein